MKKAVFIFGCIVISFFAMNASSFAGEDIPSAQEVIKALGLQPMSDEACPGYFLSTYESPVKARHSKDRSAGSLIYYLMTDEVRIDPWHRISSDEIMLYHAGAPMSMLLLYPDGAFREVVLGPDMLAGHVQQFVIPAGVWMGFAKQDRPDYRWGLYGVMVVPGWHIEDIEFTVKGSGMSKELMEKYPGAVQRGKELGLF